MSEPTLIQSKTSLPIAEIAQFARLRPVSPAGVATIVASIREIGQIASPVVVRQRPRKGGGHDYVLLDGAHRLSAATELGWTEVPVRVFECNDEQARLLEIDGNLAGAELNPLDTAVFLARRKEAYERLHPETRAGFAGAFAKHKLANDIVSFAEITAEKFSLSRRHVERLVAAGSRLGPDEIGQLRMAPKPVTLKDLQVIAKIGAAPERYDVVQMLSEGTAKSAADARLKYKTAQPDYHGPAPRSPEDTELLALLNAWSRARRAVKRKFVAGAAPELEALIAEIRSVAEDDS
ncbi:MAG: ParB N-terminal domain-containing protein [Paracoccus sp. (in: a-proteobacteria)]|nr:ParB N-terminal domain-containing protein [Paracoccus sp. (in: a-proteobacteria)]